MSSQRLAVEIDGRRLSLSNLEKVLYPEVGFTKVEVIDYYTRIAPVMLPHLTGRPLTRKRYPNGVDGAFFFEKNAPSHTLQWVDTVTLPVPGSTMGREEITYIVCDDRATLVWLANLAALELHVPQWRIKPRGGAAPPDLLVFDLDPGPPATVVECTRVALMLSELLAEDKLTGYPKTSGAKGMQLYVPIKPTSDERTSGYAKQLAELLERQHRELVVARMDKRLRHGKVFVDWSQNNAAKTTVAPYSLRAQAAPTVSTPLTWAEVEACDDPTDVRFQAGDVLDRVDQLGDLFADLGADKRPSLPTTPRAGKR
ncbi:MAG TPA: non-homologous end-joining DNA ligase [Actinomycetes bacterium]|nr:non-homologous end-joining DNA ligase [Actinomycetes bacterium]